MLLAFCVFGIILKISKKQDLTPMLFLELRGDALLAEFEQPPMPQNLLQLPFGNGNTPVIHTDIADGFRH